MNNEPLFSIGAIVAAVASIVGLLRAFGVPISDDQQTAINQVLIAVGPLAVAFLARRLVTPLVAPRDTDGATLSRPNDVPANKELAMMQTKAISINEGKAE